MLRILIADPIAEEGLARLREAGDVEWETHSGLGPAELADALGGFDGMIIRSSVKVTGETLTRPGRLRVIARAGVGVDNVDVGAATRAGILVLNTPDANTLSTAEHTIAMMLALFRRIPEAHVHVTGGGWERRAFVGHQVAGKALGIVGLGRVGRAVAERALGFQMRVLAYDPFLRTETALDGRVAIINELDDLLPRVDCLSLHAALTDDTRDLINADRLRFMKQTSVLINCARGALVDETALAEALKAGRLAGAAIDVFTNEPPQGSPLLRCPNVVLTPHLGAATGEAQTSVSIEAVEAMLDYLRDGTIRNAVNVADLPSQISQRDRAYLDLADRMAGVLAIWCGEGIDRIEVTVAGGDALAVLGPTLALQAVVGMMRPHIEDRINLVNARSFVHQRGIDIRNAAAPPDRDYHELITIKVDRRDQSHAVVGAVFTDNRPRILAIDGYPMEMVPEGRLVLIFNDDRPGVIGLVGTFFGDRQINIADLFLSRRAKTALMVLKCDGDVPETLLDDLRRAEPILSVRTVELPFLASH